MQDVFLIKYIGYRYELSYMNRKNAPHIIYVLFNDNGKIIDSSENEDEIYHQSENRSEKTRVVTYEKVSP